MLKKKQIPYLLLFLTLLGGIIVYAYLYKPHRDIEKERVIFEVDAKKIIQSFLDEPELANNRYLNKTIGITGTITAIDQNNLIVDNRLLARFKHSITQKVGDTMRFKGRCIGYDDLLEELRFDQCHLLEQH